MDNDIPDSFDTMTRTQIKSWLTAHDVEWDDNETSLKSHFVTLAEKVAASLRKQRGVAAAEVDALVSEVEHPAEFESMKKVEVMAWLRARGVDLGYGKARKSVYVHMAQELLAQGGDDDDSDAELEDEGPVVPDFARWKRIEIIHWLKAQGKSLGREREPKAVYVRMATRLAAGESSDEEIDQIDVEGMTKNQMVEWLEKHASYDAHSLKDMKKSGVKRMVMSEIAAMTPASRRRAAPVPGLRGDVIPSPSEVRTAAPQPKSSSKKQKRGRQKKRKQPKKKRVVETALRSGLRRAQKQRVHDEAMEYDSGVSEPDTPGPVGGAARRRIDFEREGAGSSGMRQRKYFGNRSPARSRPVVPRNDDGMDDDSATDDYSATSASEDDETSFNYQDDQSFLGGENSQKLVKLVTFTLRALVLVLSVIVLIVVLRAASPETVFCDTGVQPERTEEGHLSCIPCPEHGKCVEGKLECDSGYEPTGAFCGLSQATLAAVENLEQLAQSLLRHRLGQSKCGNVHSAGLSETELRQALQQHGKGSGSAEQDLALRNTMNKLKGGNVPGISVPGAGRQVQAASSSDGGQVVPADDHHLFVAETPAFTWSCWFYVMFAENLFVLLTSLAVSVTLLVAYTRYSRHQRRKKRALEAANDVLTLLSNYKFASTSTESEGNAAEGMPISQLKQLVLGDDPDEEVWGLVQQRVERNSCVRKIKDVYENVPTSQWKWIAQTPHRGRRARISSRTAPQGRSPMAAPFNSARGYPHSAVQGPLA